MSDRVNDGDNSTNCVDRFTAWYDKMLSFSTKHVDNGYQPETFYTTKPDAQKRLADDVDLFVTFCRKSKKHMKQFISAAFLLVVSLNMRKHEQRKINATKMQLGRRNAIKDANIGAASGEDAADANNGATKTRQQRPTTPVSKFNTTNYPTIFGNESPIRNAKPILYLHCVVSLSKRVPEMSASLLRHVYVGTITSFDELQRLASMPYSEWKNEKKRLDAILAELISDESAQKDFDAKMASFASALCAASDATNCSRFGEVAFVLDRGAYFDYHTRTEERMKSRCLASYVPILREEALLSVGREFVAKRIAENEVLLIKSPVHIVEIIKNYEDKRRQTERIVVDIKNSKRQTTSRQTNGGGTESSTLDDETEYWTYVENGRLGPIKPELVIISLIERSSGKAKNYLASYLRGDILDVQARIDDVGGEKRVVSLMTMNWERRMKHVRVGNSIGIERLSGEEIRSCGKYCIVERSIKQGDIEIFFTTQFRYKSKTKRSHGDETTTPTSPSTKVPEKKRKIEKKVIPNEASSPRRNDDQTSDEDFDDEAMTDANRFNDDDDGY